MLFHMVDQSVILWEDLPNWIGQSYYFLWQLWKVQSSNSKIRRLPKGLDASKILEIKKKMLAWRSLVLAETLILAPWGCGSNPPWCLQYAVLQMRLNAANYQEMERRGFCLLCGAAVVSLCLSLVLFCNCTKTTPGATWKYDEPVLIIIDVSS